MGGIVPAVCHYAAAGVTPRDRLSLLRTELIEDQCDTDIQNMGGSASLPYGLALLAALQSTMHKVEKAQSAESITVLALASNSLAGLVSPL